MDTVSLSSIYLALVVMPLLAALVTLLCYRISEHKLALWLKSSTTFNVLATLVTIGAVGLGHIGPVIDLGSVFNSGDYSLNLVLLADLKAICFLSLSSFMVRIIVHFARVYLHREQGFNRFFRTLFVAQFGLNILATAGNFDLFFAGWEVVGLTSFLLISFYRDRAAPIINAFKIYCIYRICDIGIIVGAFLDHHEFGEKHNFLNFDSTWVTGLMSQHPYMVYLLGLSILLPALGKSAQFPFCFWLPRALEGPTPSSAVFYGALSIQAGLFLLLRTEPIWEPVLFIKILIFCCGLLSVIIGSLCGRSQANIKGQLAYASIAQVGIMFMEVALGLGDLVMIHFWLHAFLRTYQFLISPSVVTYFIKYPVKHRASFSGLFSGTPWLRRLAVGEFFLEETFEAFVVKPLVKLGSSWKYLAAFSLVVYLGVRSLEGNLLSAEALVLSLAVSLRAFSIKDSAYAIVFTLISAIGLLFSGSMMHWNPDSILACSLGIIPGILFWMTRNSIAMFVGWLCLAGFPLSPYFIGEDLLLHSLAREGIIPTLIFCTTFIINGIVLARSFILNTWLAEARPLD